MQDYDTIRSMGVKQLKAPSRELPAGRGYLVKAINAAMVQVALPAIDGRDGRSAEDQIGAIVQGLRRRYPNRAQWSYFGDDVTALETLAAGKSLDAAPVVTAPAPAVTQPVATQAVVAAAPAAVASAPAAQAAAQVAPAKPSSLAEKMAEMKAKQQALLNSMKIERPTTLNMAKLTVEVPDKPEEKKE